MSDLALNLMIEVPASSANLGPGFDALAAALDVALTVTAVPRDERRVIPNGLGADELPTGDDNLIWRALLAYCGQFDVSPPDISLRTDNDIPLERGMGSSAAAAVGGVYLGRALLQAGGTDDDLIGLATQLEGHPDNAAAALLGGLVVCADGHARRLEPSPRLRPVVCVPDARQSTKTARGVLPSSVSLADAAGNGARTAMVLAGLSGHAAWEPSLMHDVLHEPARFEVMPESGALVGALRSAGIGACLSGAGPSVLAIVTVEDRSAAGVVEAAAGDGWTVRPISWHRRGASKVNATSNMLGTSQW